MPAADTREYLSTGEAAELCSVTRDTVLKWIAAGKIPAIRTPGGHHRIAHSHLQQMLSAHQPPVTSDVSKREEHQPFQYCWEFYSRDGKIPTGCKECVVYRSGTLRCYELSELPAEAGHTRQFCEKSCDDCEYLRVVKGQRPNVLVVTDRLRLKQSLDRGAQAANFNLRITDCEYRCSMVVEEFRPDYVVIDCVLGPERSSEFAALLYEDPRIPFIKVILAGRKHELPKECDRTVFAVIEQSFSVATLSDLIGNRPNRQPGKNRTQSKELNS